MVASGPIKQILNGKDGSVYAIALKGSPDGLGQHLSELPWVIHTAAEASLLRHVLADPAGTVTEFSRKKYELEETFMKIVKGDSHDR